MSTEHKGQFWVGKTFQDVLHPRQVVLRVQERISIMSMLIYDLTETVGTEVEYERKNLVGHKKASSPMANHLRMKELDNP